MANKNPQLKNLKPFAKGESGNPVESRWVLAAAYSGSS